MLRTETRERLQHLQKKPSNIRNICILAHVDHGKTTLADSLIASNGIISQRQAGKLRFMDSRRDEQERGITMKSSAIALQFCDGREEYLINLIDSPGHVDFSSEVSTAVRLCDGAIVVVDAVEGVCPQTQAVLQQAWSEAIKPCLVINKVDRLITELKYSPTEAYYHLQQVLEQVNAVTGSLFTSQVAANRAEQQSNLEEAIPTEGEMGKEQAEVLYDWSAGLEDTDDSSLYFSPEHGNVIFTSALDGWGFGIGHFAELYAKKLGIRTDVLKKTLWGDFFLNSKAKRIFKGAQAKGKKPLFVQFVLENVWAVYEAVLLHRDKTKIEKIVGSLGLRISPRDSRHTDSRVHLCAICSQWLPLATATLNMVVEHLPSPLELTRERVEHLMCSSAKTFDSFPQLTQSIRDDFLACNVESSAPTVVFVSKLFAMDRTALPENKSRPLTQEEIAVRREAARQRHLATTTTGAEEERTDRAGIEESDDSSTDEPIFLAFSRVFSGSVHRGQSMFILHPRYDPRTVDQSVLSHDLTDLDTPDLPEHVSSFTVRELYLLMGRGLVSVDEVPAGNVLGIAGLEEHVLKSATVSSSLACPAFRSMSFAAAPIVRVAIEPEQASEMPALIRGMRLLNQADPCVEVSVQQTGECILSTAGEVHLQRCLDDLRDQYARVKLNVSSPIIPFRETIVPPPKLDMVNEVISSENEVMLAAGATGNGSSGEPTTGGVVSIQTANKACTLKIQVEPLPPQVTQILEKSTHLLKALGSLRAGVELNQETISQLAELKARLKSAFSGYYGEEEEEEEEEEKKSGLNWKEAVDLIWSFGPRHTGPNILLNGLPSYSRPSIWSTLTDGSSERQPLRDYDNSIISGFQLASLAGPLCEEPLHGVAIILREWTYGGSRERAQGEEREEKGGHNSDVKEFEPQSGVRDTAPKNGGGGSSSSDTYGPLSGQLISAMKEGCRRAFLAQPARLMAAMYSCSILATAEVLGKIHAVLGRRNGSVQSEEMREGSAVFSVEAVVPVAESFGFAEEIRKKTSGLASPQLLFSHWEVMPSDPFWVPSTEEELLHFGEKADSDNLARRYMNSVRKRKGLSVEEKLVEHGEKQRTLKKNK